MMDDQERKAFIEALIAFKRFWLAPKNTKAEQAEVENFVAAAAKLQELDK